ncbi:MAG: 2'-5' RNA ligase family protein [Cyclobacteriaceae bacterium]
MSKALYFIAIIPPSPVFEEVLELKNYFKEKYNSKASLNSPPHITLHMPFAWKTEKERRLIDGLEKFTEQYSPFDLQLVNFRGFEPRVIYIDVVKTEALQKLQKELHRYCKKEFNLFNANYKEHAYHPHITLAFRDLKKHEFVKAWEEFKEKKFEGGWSIQTICLLKHDGKKWDVLKDFKLTRR